MCDSPFCIESNWDMRSKFVPLDYSYYPLWRLNLIAYRLVKLFIDKFYDGGINIVWVTDKSFSISNFDWDWFYDDSRALY